MAADKPSLGCIIVKGGSKSQGKRIAAGAIDAIIAGGKRVFSRHVRTNKQPRLKSCNVTIEGRKQNEQGEPWRRGESQK